MSAAVEGVLAWARRRATVLSLALLAALAYVPALTASPGRMPSDSKLYVYLDPGRFIGDTLTTFDPRQFAGWVPHQHIAYLWPTGPWYWCFEQLAVPDWVAHRLWIGTVLFLAGAGVRWMARVLGFVPLAALAAAVVYQLSPYVLPYVSRTSVLLLPFAGLGWIVGCTVLAARRGRWRYPALIALIVLTVGAVNATALAMIIPAPALWLAVAASTGVVSWRRAAATAGRVAVLSTAVSLWWMAMLVIQGRRGADVLAYSESLESVSFTSTSTEVARGLGYWLFYIRDGFAATTTASIDHLLSVPVVIAGFAVLALCLLGVVAIESPHRRFAALSIGVGVVLGVGVHPIDDPSPLMDVLLGNGQGGLALALRSSTRAVPVLLLGLSIGAATLVTSAGTVAARLGRPRAGVPARVVAAGVVATLAVVGLPALRTGGFVDEALVRDQDPPAHWLEATDALDERPDGYRVLQVPGTEFGAFAWGYTVDQPLPGLTERPLVTRDLLPLGSPAAMDLVFALDDRIQADIVEADSVGPISRLLGVDVVWVSGDVAFDRFSLARPEVVTDELTNDAARAAGLTIATPYGPAAPLTTRVPMLDAEALGDPRVGTAIAPITLVEVDDPVPTVRAKDRTVLVAGSGDGLIDAAAAGLLDGGEAVLYAADGEPPAGVDPERVIITDSNRRRAHHWRSSQDVHGYTEEIDGGVLVFQPADERLAVFGDEPDVDDQTVAIQRGPVTARASAYGEPFAYRPEHRAVMAVDGDPATAWLVADRAPAVGEYIELTVDGTVDFVELRQPTPERLDRRVITAVQVSVDGVDRGTTELGAASLSAPGQRIDLAPAASAATGDRTVVRITIAATSDPQPAIGEALGAVGFTEIGVGRPATAEWIRLPRSPAVATIDDVATAIVMSRLRTEPTDRWRDDPEPVLRREFELAHAVDGEMQVTLRIDQRAGGQLLAELLGEGAWADRSLTGVPAARGAAAVDGDPSTAWISPFDQPVGATLTLEATGAATMLEIDQPSGPYSTITAMRLTDGDGAVDVEVPVDGRIELPRPMSLDGLTLSVADATAEITIDRRYAEPVALPVAIAELRVDGATPDTPPPSPIVAICRDDLLTVDGRSVALSFTASVDDVERGAPLTAEVCDDPAPLAAGGHRVQAVAGAATGVHVDRVVIADRPVEREPVADTALDPTSRVLTDADARSGTIEVPACPDGCWAIVGEGYNEAWAASVDGDDLGAPRLVDGIGNGWWLPPSDSPRTVEYRWTAQRPLDLALLASALAVLACVALILRDRRRDDDPAPLPGVVEVAPTWRSVTPVRRDIAAVAAIALAAGLLVGWPWLLPAAIVAGGAVAAGRPSLVAWAGWVLVVRSGLVVAWVVRDERPFPGAGWPVRFEWLHPWTLLGVVLVAAGALLRTADEMTERATDRP